MNFKKLFVFPILFYQKYLTHLAYGSCRYYPTCSQYTKEQFLFNSLWKAPFLSLKRILSCNQLFKGGIDYPVLKVEKFKTGKEVGEIRYWFVPTKKKNSYFLVKSFISFTK
jgi:putative membrane protein insertion efficiency factor